MTIDYQLETADFAAIASESRRFTPHPLSRIYYFGVLPILGVMLAIAIQSFLTAGVFTVAYLTSAWFVDNRIRQEYLRNAYSEENLPLSLRRWNATFVEEGIRLTSEAADVLYRWSFVRHVFRNTRFVHIEMTKLQTVHIPIRAFRDENIIQKFVSEAQSQIKKHPR